MLGTTVYDWLPDMCSGICTFGRNGLLLNSIKKDESYDLTEYPKNIRTKKWMIAQMLHCGENVDEELSLQTVQAKFEDWARLTSQKQRKESTPKGELARKADKLKAVYEAANNLYLASIVKDRMEEVESLSAQEVYDKSPELFLLRFFLSPEEKPDTTKTPDPIALQVVYGSQEIDSWSKKYGIHILFFEAHICSADSHHIKKIAVLGWDEHRVNSKAQRLMKSYDTAFNQAFDQRFSSPAQAASTNAKLFLRRFFLDSAGRNDLTKKPRLFMGVKDFSLYSNGWFEYMDSFTVETVDAEQGLVAFGWKKSEISVESVVSDYRAQMLKEKERREIWMKSLDKHSRFDASLREQIPHVNKIRDVDYWKLFTGEYIVESDDFPFDRTGEKPFKMSIYLDKNDPESFLVASFFFGALEGVMRLVGPIEDESEDESSDNDGNDGTEDRDDDTPENPRKRIKLEAEPNTESADSISTDKGRDTVTEKVYRVRKALSGSLVMKDEWCTVFWAELAYGKDTSQTFIIHGYKTGWAKLLPSFLKPSWNSYQV